MKLNVRTSKSDTSFVGVKIYDETLAELDAIGEKVGIKRSALLRHALNEFLDNYEGEEESDG